MASVSIHVNDIDPILRMRAGNTCISVTCRGYVTDHIVPKTFEERQRDLFSRDILNLHGTVEQIREFATAILSALPLPAMVLDPSTEGNDNHEQTED